MHKKIIYLIVAASVMLLGVPAFGDMTDESVLGNDKWRVIGAGDPDSYTQGDLVPATTNTYSIGNSTLYPQEIYLGGVGKSSWGSVVSPWEDSGTTTVLTSAPTKFILTHSTGVSSFTGYIAGTADVVLENGQIIDGGTNNAVILTDNSDSISFTASGNDWVIDSTDGGIMFTLTDATDGTVDIQTNNDADDYIQISTTTNQPLINFVGCNGKITAASGTIDFDNEILTTTGALSAGATTVTSVIIGDDTYDVVVDDEFRFASNDESSTIEAYGFEAKDAILRLTGDQGDDNGDIWELESDVTTNSLLIGNDTSGSVATMLTISTAGKVTTTGDVLVAGTTPVVTIGDAGAEDTSLNYDGNAVDFHIALDDSADALEIGFGTTVETDERITIDGSATETIITLGDAAAEDMSLNFDGNSVDFHISLDDSADELEIGYGTTIETDERITIMGSATETIVAIGDAAEEDMQIYIDGNAADFRFGVDDSADDLEIGLGTTMETDERITIDGGANTTIVTLGDAAEYDTILVLDGNAQDFYIGLDDTDDDLNIGVGATPGTTAAIEIDENANVTVTTSIRQPYEIVAATNTITINESGKLFVLNSATEFASTLPAVSTAAGCYYDFVIGAAPADASYTIVTGNTHENIMYGCIQESETDTTEDGPTAQAQDTITFNDGVAVVGDYVRVRSDGVNWYVEGMTAADGAIAFSTT